MHICKSSSRVHVSESKNIFSYSSFSHTVPICYFYKYMWKLLLPYTITTISMSVTFGHYFLYTVARYLFKFETFSLLGKLWITPCSNWFSLFLLLFTFYTIYTSFPCQFNISCVSTLISVFIFFIFPTLISPSCIEKSISTSSKDIYFYFLFIEVWWYFSEESNCSVSQSYLRKEEFPVMPQQTTVLLILIHEISGFRSHNFSQILFCPSLYCSTWYCCGLHKIPGSTR